MQDRSGEGRMGSSLQRLSTSIDLAKEIVFISGKKYTKLEVSDNILELTELIGPIQRALGAIPDDVLEMPLTRAIAKLQTDPDKSQVVDAINVASRVYIDTNIRSRQKTARSIRQLIEFFEGEIAKLERVLSS